MLIGLTGYAGSGKDTAAEYLVVQYNFERRAFANKLRELAYATGYAVDIDGTPCPLRGVVNRYGWDESKRRYPAVREILQDVGQAHRDVFGEDFWLNQVLPDLKGAALRGWQYRNRKLVVSDVRYPNEADRVRALGGTVVRVERPGVGPVNGHVSEQLIRAEYTVANITGEPEILQRELDDLMEGK